MTGWATAEMGTVSDFFRLHRRFFVFLLVVRHSTCPCASFQPVGAVQGRSGSEAFVISDKCPKTDPFSMTWRVLLIELDTRNPYGIPGADIRAVSTLNIDRRRA